MNKSHNGKIDNLVDNGYNKQYIGSTTESLSQRMARHRSDYKRKNEGKKVSNASSFHLFDEFGAENCKIELIEYCKVDTKDELLRCEGEYIRSNSCVNKNIPTRTIKEWKEDNIETIKINCKIYRDNNKEEISLKKKQVYEINKEQILKQNKIWRDTHKQEQKEYWKTFREVNTQKIKDWNATKIQCQCGITHTQTNKARHKRTKKHQEYLKSLENQDD